MTFTLSILSGILLGIISGRTYLAHSWVALFPWALVGLFLGMLAKSRGLAIRGGVIYGFCLQVAFVITTHTGGFGSLSKLLAFAALAAILGIIGAACGIACGLIGSRLNIRKP